MCKKGKAPEIQNVMLPIQNEYGGNRNVTNQLLNRIQIADVLPKLIATDMLSKWKRIKEKEKLRKRLAKKDERKDTEKTGISYSQFISGLHSQPQHVFKQLNGQFDLKNTLGSETVDVSWLAHYLGPIAGKYVNEMTKKFSPIANISLQDLAEQPRIH